MSAGDDEFVRLAREALAPPSVEPPARSMAALRAAVDTRLAPRRAGRNRVWKVRAAAVVAGLVTLVSGTATGAAIAGASLPVPLRDIASGIGLPVDSPGLAQAKSDAGRLRQALRHHDAPMIGRDASALERTFDRLDSGDRRSIDGEVDALLNQAATYSGHQSGGSDGPGPTSTSGDGGGRGPSGGDGDPTPSTTVTGNVAPLSGTEGGVSTDGGGDGSASSASSTTSTTSTTVPSGSGGGGGGSDGGSVSGTDGG